MKTVKEIIKIEGYDSAQEMAVGDRIEVGGGPYMDLTIEKIYEDKLSVAHYYTQRGDLMSDPEIVFEIHDDHWRAIRYTQHPNIHEYDETGLPDVETFAEGWSENLRRQNFIERANEM